MFRQRMQSRPETQPGDWFVSRVCELPVVNSAVGQISSMYSGVKQHNRLFRFTLETAEGGMGVVVGKARPVVAKFDKPIGTLNSIACHQLAKLEHEFPIITKPTDEVIKETRQLCDNAVRPLVERVSAVKQYGVDKVTGVRSFTTEKINGVKAYGVNTLASVGEIGTKQVGRVMETSLCRNVVTGLDTALGYADYYVDAYLPPLPEAEDEKASSSDSAAVAPTGEQKLIMCKARNIGNKVRRRMYARIAGRMKVVQLRSQETIAHLNFTVDLLEYSRGTMNSAKDKARYIWTEVNKSEEEVARELADSDAETRLHSDSTFERKTLATARHLTQKTKHVMAGVGLPLDNLPDAVYARLESIRNLLPASIGIPSTTNLLAINGYVLHLLGDYRVLVQHRFSAVLQWVVNLEPVKTMAPGLGRLVFPASATADEQPNAKCSDKSRCDDPLPTSGSSHGADVRGHDGVHRDDNVHRRHQQMEMQDCGGRDDDYCGGDERHESHDGDDDDHVEGDDHYHSE